MSAWKLARNGYLVISILIFLAAIWYTFYPSVTSDALCVFGGTLLLGYGVIKIIGYFSDDMYRLAFQYDFACGILLIVLGVITLASQFYGVDLTEHLSSGLGFLVMMDGLLTIQMARDARQFGLETWHIILIISIIACVLGGLTMIWAFRSGAASSLVVSVTLLAEGLKTLMVTLYTVKRRETKYDNSDI